MSTIKFTREMARQTFNTLAERVPDRHLIELYGKRLAVRRRGDTVLFYFQELPTEDVIGWVGGINARMYYGADGKRLPIGSSVDDLYKRVNLWLQQQTKSSQPQPIKGGKTTNEIKYPYFEEREEMALDKRFNGQLCHHTGRVMVNGPTAADVWNEYVDSDGEFHYGR